MKRIAAPVFWITLFVLLSLLTTSLAAANTTPPDLPAVQSAAVPLRLAGGPDPFGYTFQDQDETGGPGFAWTDISGTTPLTLLPAQDDGAADLTTAADLAGFDFDFYGVTLTTLRVSNNGLLLLNPPPGPSGKLADNFCLDSPSAPTYLIAPWWDDWETGAVYWERQGSGDDEHLIIQWEGMRHYADPGSDTVSFQVVLSERGNLIHFYYNDAVTAEPYNLGARGTIGIRASVTDYQQYGCDTAVLIDQDDQHTAVRFQHSSITVIKDTTPNDAQDFPFTSTLPDYATFSLDDDAGAPGGDDTLSNQLAVNLLPGTYTVTEDDPAPDWGLSSLACVSDLPPGDFSTLLSTRTATINLDPGEHVTCTFTNGNTGTIVVRKITNPGSDSPAFSFNSDIPGNETFSLDTDGATGTPSSLTFAGLTPGAYTVTEADPAAQGWDLSGLTCVDPNGGDSSVNVGARTATINVAPGETVTCNFINTERGTIKIVKDANPTHEQDFTFSGTLGDFTLDDDGEEVTVLSSRTVTVAPGSYTVTEGAAAGWDLTNLTCDDPSGGTTTDLPGRAAAIALAPGETVSCTFTNTRRGTIEIYKNALPDDSQDFTFTGSGGITAFTLDDDADPTLVVSQTLSLPAGTYAITETATSGWDLTGLTCVDPSGGTTTDLPGGAATINLDPDETVTCTFENTKRGAIEIIKDATPADGQDFSFSSTLEDFDLDDDADGALLNTKTFIDVAHGVYTVTEQALPANWDLSALTCTDPDNGTATDLGSATATIDLDPGETVSCTFQNEKQGTIQIVKDAEPADGQDFTFTGSGGLGNFTLDDDADGTWPASRSFAVVPGSYTVTEGAAANWDLTGLICNDPDDGTTIAGATATIDLDPGETVTCTFENTKWGVIEIYKDAIPDDSQDFGFTGSGGIAGFSLDDDAEPTLAVSQTLSLPAGTYAITETAVMGWDLTGLTCDDLSGGTTTDLPNRAVTIDLAAGETVSCTFENTAQRGTLEIIKDADPADGEDFSFSSTFEDFYLDDDGGADPTLSDTRTFNNVAHGVYTVTEQSLPTNWDLSGLSCTDPDNGTTTDLGSATATIDLDPGETVRCTFRNEKRGTIQIVKDAVPDDGQDFTFMGSGSLGSFSLDDDADATLAASESFTVAPGSYTVTEGAANGWDLTNLTCTDPSDDTTTAGTTATIALDPGETVSCTFTNTKRGKIEIYKNALPDDSQDFGFTGSGGITGFSLDDDADPTLAVSQTLSLPPGTYAITETATTGWDLTGLTCDDPSGGTTTDLPGGAATIGLASNETVTCVFTNTAKPGSLTVFKETTSSTPASFQFQLGVVPFWLDNDPATPLPPSMTITSLVSGTYDLIELVTPGWTLQDISCADPTGDTEPLVDGVSKTTVRVSPGEAITCVVTNTQASNTGSITIVKEAYPENDQAFTFTGDLGPFYIVDDGTSGNVYPRPGLPPRTYVITETALAGWSLTDLTCDQPVVKGDRSVAITLAGGDNVRCVFTNTVNSSITIVKNVLPDTSAESFSFTGSTGIGGFSLTDNGPSSPYSQTFALVPGTYAITETVGAGWNLDQITCTGAASAPQVQNPGVTVVLGQNEDVTCTFTNSPASGDNSSTVYLPLILRDFATGPNLIASLAVDSGVYPPRVTVTVQNIGSEPVDEPFWVDVYLDPNPLPGSLTGADRRWQQVSGKGIAWPVTTPLAANGGTVILTSDSGFDPNQTDWSSLPPGNHTVYAFADSYDNNDPEGALYVEVIEIDETDNQSPGVPVNISGVGAASTQPPKQFPPRGEP